VALLKWVWLLCFSLENSFSCKTFGRGFSGGAGATEELYQTSQVYSSNELQTIQVAYDHFESSCTSMRI
jgi:hypothetical protein